jgi:hypothetical protein
VLDFKVIPEGFEPSTYCLEGSCSIQLSYGTIKKKLHFSSDFFKEPIKLKEKKVPHSKSGCKSKLFFLEWK